MATLKAITGEIEKPVDRAHELAEMIIRLAGLKEGRSEQNAMYRDEIKKLEMKIQELSIKIKTNQEDIPF